MKLTGRAVRDFEWMTSQIKGRHPTFKELTSKVGLKGEPRWRIVGTACAVCGIGLRGAFTCGRHRVPRFMRRLAKRRAKA